MTNKTVNIFIVINTMFVGAGLSATWVTVPQVKARSPAATTTPSGGAVMLHSNILGGDGTLFVAAAASEHDGQAADPAVLARVPMSVLADAPYIDASINGHGPFTFGLDTGSMNSPLARELAQRQANAAEDPEALQQVVLKLVAAQTQEQAEQVLLAAIQDLTYKGSPKKQRKKRSV